MTSIFSTPDFERNLAANGYHVVDGVVTLLPAKRHTVPIAGRVILGGFAKASPLGGHPYRYIKYSTPAEISDSLMLIPGTEENE